MFNNITRPLRPPVPPPRWPGAGVRPVAVSLYLSLSLVITVTLFPDHKLGCSSLTHGPGDMGLWA